MFIVKYRKIFYALSGILVAGSVFAMAYFGFNFGIDFTGGAITEINYPEGRAEMVLIKEKLDSLSLGEYTIQNIGEQGVILRTKSLTEDERMNVMKALSLDGTVKVEEKRFNSIGPVIGKELKNKSLMAILLVSLAIVLFISFAFRKVSDLGNEKISSWKYGIVAIFSLIHDIIIPTGIFVVLGHFYIDYQIDILFVTALLTILGFSVHDTIVVFDRVRENLKNSSRGEAFENIVGKSLVQTFGRSINTSLTTIITLSFLYFFGGETTKQFSLVLSIGIIFGTYSSIFLASPLLVTWQKFSNKE